MIRIRRIYDDVHDAFRTSMDTLAVGAPCRDYQVRVCDLFAARGIVRNHRLC